VGARPRHTGANPDAAGQSPRELSHSRTKELWSERSEAATKKRYEKLVLELQDLETNYPKTDEGMEAVLWAIEGLFMLAGLCTVMVAILLMNMVQAPVMFVSPADQTQLKVFAIFASVMAIFLGVAVSQRISRVRWKTSPTYRATLRKSIEELKLRSSKQH
jgi:hypothetical protein